MKRVIMAVALLAALAAAEADGSLVGSVGLLHKPAILVPTSENKNPPWKTGAEVRPIERRVSRTRRSST